MNNGGAPAGNFKRASLEMKQSPLDAENRKLKDKNDNEQEESVDALIAKLNSKGARVKLLSDDDERTS